MDLNWVVEVDLRDDIMQDDLHFYAATEEEANAMVTEFLKVGHVALTGIRSGLPQKTAEGKEITPQQMTYRTLYPISGVKSFTVRYVPRTPRA